MPGEEAEDELMRADLNEWEYGESDPCPICSGTGYVNPLTAPDGFLCLSTTECPACDGEGEAF